jgi:hypothetical protein
LCQSHEAQAGGSDRLDHSAVDDVLGAGDVAGDVGEEERDQGCDFLGLGHAPGRDPLGFQDLVDEVARLLPAPAAILPSGPSGS